MGFEPASCSFQTPEDCKIKVSIKSYLAEHREKMFAIILFSLLRMASLYVHCSLNNRYGFTVCPLQSKQQIHSGYLLEVVPNALSSLHPKTASDQLFLNVVV